MPCQRVAMILRSRTDLSDDQIAQLSDAEGWQLIYTLKPPNRQVQKKTSQICFTGFSSSEKDRLSQLAAADGLDVMKSVTQSLAYLVVGPNTGPLAYLVVGPNTGPAKLRSAREHDVVIMNEGQFSQFLLDGSTPDLGSSELDYLAEIDRTMALGIGILDLLVVDTPTAILDFETTGMSPGMDRVVEVSVVRREPGGRSEIVFDTLVNPRRPMAATEIHGITDADVSGAPAFEEVAGELARAISGCVLAAYNVYFDMRFFEYEMGRAGVPLDPPHVCLMYLRPLLGLGSRCSLGDACQAHGVPYSGSHMAGDDAEASAQLMEFYLGVMRAEGIQSFRDLSQRGTYKFLRSFDRSILRCDSASSVSAPNRLRSRRRCCKGSDAAVVASAPTEAQGTASNGLAVYWDGLKAAVADLQIDDDEAEHLRRVVEKYQLRQEQVRMLHARAFASVISQFINDQFLDNRESRKLKRLHQCLSKLGWAPGE
jgi:DNA polymerase III subunit epsilon